MESLESAQARILRDVSPLPSERVALDQASDRFLATGARSIVDVPPFDNSAMDGYAVRAADVASASPTAPVELRRVDRIPAGEPPRARIEPGTCARIFTGSPLPPGADAVVMQEDTRVDSDGSDRVRVLDRVAPWDNIRFRGEDVKIGSEILGPGHRCSAERIAVLAACGIAEVDVGRRPRIALLATGNELREPGSPLPAGCIYESNRVGLAAAVRRLGGDATPLPIVPDDLNATRQAFLNARERCDVLMTTGGVSVGEMDLLKPAFESAGGVMEFWRVALKPGKPFVHGRLGAMLWFGLPGNPVSAFVTFLLLVRPVILRLQGAAQLSLPSVPGVLSEPIQNRGDRRHFMRVVRDEAGAVRSAGRQGSHALSSLAASNGFIDVPPDTSLPSGAPVAVLSLH
ncbi:MAG: molybdopterin molybdotransferase MoeA [Verrucomicrobia bacterium]|nr:molybdopterin molybdotransferase MoeA [Verrucomicrobiota bacterium]